MRGKRISLALAGIALLCSTPLQAQTVFINNNSPWMIQKGETQTGVLVSVVEELARRTGQPLKARAVPTARIAEQIKSGDLELAITSVPVPPNLLMSAVIKFPVVLMANKKFPLKAYEDAKSLRVGYVKGTNYGTAFDQDTAITKSEEPDVGQIIKKIQGNRLDAGVASLLIMRSGLKTENAQNDITQMVVLGQASQSFVANPDKVPAALRDAIKSALDAMASDGTVKKIVAQYLDDDWNTRD